MGVAAAPAGYAPGADIVLNGHDHVYARWAPMAPDGTLDPRHGIRQFTVGTGGENHDTLASPLPAAVQVANENQWAGSITAASVSLMASEPSDIVEAGYDRLAVRYLAWINEIRGDPRLQFLHDLMGRLPARPAVLDLGCGAGVPCTVLLAERGDVTGVDLSSSQLALARQNAPSAHFIKADMTRIELPPASFDAVTAFYSIAHLSRAHHGSLFQRIATWLRPGGHFLASLGCDSVDGTVGDWLGAPMYFSSHDAHTNRRLIAEAGLTVLVDEAVTMQEPQGPATFQWVIASKLDL